MRIRINKAQIRHDVAVHSSRFTFNRARARVRAKTRIFARELARNCVAEIIRAVSRGFATRSLRDVIGERRAFIKNCPRAVSTVAQAEHFIIASPRRELAVKISARIDSYTSRNRHSLFTRRRQRKWRCNVITAIKSKLRPTRLLTLASWIPEGSPPRWISARKRARCRRSRE